jgi:hypothetical protein
MTAHRNVVAEDGYQERDDCAEAYGSGFRAGREDAACELFVAASNLMAIRGPNDPRAVAVRDAAALIRETEATP